MQNTDGGTVRRIFVKVFGFSDVERHALNTVFRLSESRPVAYALWTADAPEKAHAALMDGDKREAFLELANPDNDTLKLVWVGDRPSDKAVLVIARPLQWAAVIEGLDRLFASAPEDTPPGAGMALDFDISAASPLDIDLDLDLGTSGDAEAITAPAPLQPAAATPAETRVLLIDAERDARLYLRAKFSMAGLAWIDEAETGAQALELLHTNAYGLVLVDLGLGDVNSWTLIREIRASRPATARLIVTGAGLTPLDAVRAWFAGAKGALAKPLHPGKLKRLLEKLQQTQR